MFVYPLTTPDARRVAPLYLQLSSSTENKDLWQHFTHCGHIVDIQIRASSGVCVPTAKLPTPYWGMGTPLESVHYATIRFAAPEGARNAMDLGGTELLGKKIVVSLSIPRSRSFDELSNTEHDFVLGGFS